MHCRDMNNEANEPRLSTLTPEQHIAALDRIKGQLLWLAANKAAKTASAPDTDAANDWHGPLMRFGPGAEVKA
jgi:hypothetical protein